MMVTTLSGRGRTVIPTQIRKRFNLKVRQRLEWAEDGKMIYILPVAKDPIFAFRGSAPRGLMRALLADRRKDAPSAETFYNRKGARPRPATEFCD